MDIQEMQEVPEGPWPFIEDTIQNLHRQYREGITKEISYHSQLALLYSNIKNVEEVRLHAALVPDTADDMDRENIYISLGRMSVYEKKLDEAIVYYEKCLDVTADHEMALDEIAWCCYHERRYPEAEKWFRKAVVIDDMDWDTTWEGLALTLSALKKYEEAIPCFNRAMELESSKINTNYFEYLMGLCYANEKDFYRALSHYNKSLDADPRYGPSLTNVATLYYEHESDIKTAIEYLKKAEEVAEADKDMGTLQLVYINLTRLYTQLSEYELKEFYNAKLLEILGFGGMFEGEEGDEEDEEDTDENSVE